MQSVSRWILTWPWKKQRKLYIHQREALHEQHDTTAEGVPPKRAEQRRRNANVDRDNAPNQQAKQRDLSMEALSAPIVAKVSIAETNALQETQFVTSVKKRGHYSFQCYGKSVVGIAACNDIAQAITLIKVLPFSTLSTTVQTHLGIQMSKLAEEPFTSSSILELRSLHISSKEFEQTEWH